MIISKTRSDGLALTPACDIAVVAHSARHRLPALQGGNRNGDRQLGPKLASSKKSRPGFFYELYDLSFKALPAREIAFSLGHEEQTLSITHYSPLVHFPVSLKDL